MKKLLISSIILFLLSSCTSKQNEINLKLEKEKIHTVLTGFFQALDDHNWDKLKSLTTEDFILVEHGVLWNNDSLINAIENSWADYELNYSLDNIKTHVDGNSAWTVYRNHLIATNEEREVQFHWIETVIFTKENEQWKMIEAQSTMEKEPEIIDKTQH